MTTTITRARIYTCEMAEMTPAHWAPKAWRNLSLSDREFCTTRVEDFLNAHGPRAASLPANVRVFVEILDEVVDYADAERLTESRVYEVTYYPHCPDPRHRVSMKRV